MAFALFIVLAFPFPYTLETSSWSGPTLNSDTTILWLSSSFTATSPSRRSVAIPDREPSIFSSCARPLLGLLERDRWFLLFFFLLFLLLFSALEFLFCLFFFPLFFFLGPLRLSLVVLAAFLFFFSSLLLSLSACFFAFCLCFLFFAASRSSFFFPFPFFFPLLVSSASLFFCF